MSAIPKHAVHGDWRSHLFSCQSPKVTDDLETCQDIRISICSKLLYRWREVRSNEVALVLGTVAESSFHVVVTAMAMVKLLTSSLSFLAMSSIPQTQARTQTCRRTPGTMTMHGSLRSSYWSYSAHNLLKQSNSSHESSFQHSCCPHP